jgi:hypothetical protein
MGWELIAGGVILAAVVAGITLSLNYAKQRGRAEAERDASEAARKLENELRDIASQELTADEVIKRIRNKQFGGPR